MLTCKVGNTIINCFDGKYDKFTLKKWSEDKRLICPDCGKLYKYCHGEVIHPYFRHKEKNKDCEGIYYKQETEEHIDGKTTKDAIQEFENYPRDILQFNVVMRPIHPTQKPIELCEYFINTYTNKNDLILDICIGSGTTAIACINTSRNYIGFELDNTYYEVANKRIEECLNDKTG